VEWGLRVVTDMQAQDHRTRRPPLKLMVTPTTLPGPHTTIQRRPWGENHGGEWRQRWKHHPTFDFLAPSRRAPTEQRRQRRTLVETSTTIDSQAPKRGTRSKEAHTSRYLASWPVEEHDSAFRKVCGAKGVAAVSPGNRAWLSPMVLQSTQEAS